MVEKDDSFGMGNEQRNPYWDYQPHPMSTSMDWTEPASWQEGRATGRTKAGSLNSKVYTVINNNLNQLVTTSLTGVTGPNTRPASQHRRTANCLDGVTMLQRAMSLRQRTASLLLTGSRG